MTYCSLLDAGIRKPGLNCLPVADGSFLYHLASVVDDHEMQMTHVIRAEEHLSNTPRQIFIARGLGYELPQYAHLLCLGCGSRTIERSVRSGVQSQRRGRGSRVADPHGFEPATSPRRPYAGLVRGVSAIAPRGSAIGWRSPAR